MSNWGRVMHAVVTAMSDRWQSAREIAARAKVTRKQAYKSLEQLNVNYEGIVERGNGDPDCPSLVHYRKGIALSKNGKREPAPDGWVWYCKDTRRKAKVREDLGKCPREPVLIRDGKIRGVDWSEVG